MSYPDPYDDWGNSKRISELSTELTQSQTRITELEALVREMGIQLENINKYNKYWYDTHESIFRMLSRPEVKKIMEEK